MDGKRDEPDSRGQREHLDALLDEALAQTFPASDPVAIDIASRPASSRTGASPSTSPASEKHDPAKSQN